MRDFKLVIGSLMKALVGTNNVKGRFICVVANLLVAATPAISGVPALTVHDEFIVPDGNEDLVRKFMYTTDVDIHC